MTDTPTRRARHRRPSLVLVVKGEGKKTPDDVTIVPFEDWETLEVTIEHKSDGPCCTVISEVAGYK